MSIFEVIKKVLDTLYARLDPNSRDKEIRTCLNVLSEGYKNLKNENKIMYNTDAMKFAYIYMYVTCHANLVYKRVLDSKPIKNLFKLDKVNVTSLGGGPGSDFLGILKYLLEIKKTIKLRSIFFDKESTWSDCWSSIDDHLEDSDIKTNIIVNSFDVTDLETWKSYHTYLDADLFTLTYFISEVTWAYNHENTDIKNSTVAFFENLLNRTKKGSLILFIDNDNEAFNWFNLLIEKSQLYKLLDKKAFPTTTPRDEEKQALGEYLTKFGITPKLEAKMMYSIYQKI